MQAGNEALAGRIDGKMEVRVGQTMARHGQLHIGLALFWALSI